MLKNRRMGLSVLVALAALAAVCSMADRADAGVLRRAARLDAAVATAAGDPACCEPEAKCCPQPCIRYVYRGCAKACCDSAPPVKTVLKVRNPCTCCVVEVPVCVPACCTGCPTVNERCGILCRGKVAYDWCCGFNITFRFDRCGDVTVVYRGL